MWITYSAIRWHIRHWKLKEDALRSPSLMKLLWKKLRTWHWARKLSVVTNITQWHNVTVMACNCWLLVAVTVSNWDDCNKADWTRISHIWIQSTNKFGCPNYKRTFELITQREQCDNLHIKYVRLTRAGLGVGPTKQLHGAPTCTERYHRNNRKYGARKNRFFHTQKNFS